VNPCLFPVTETSLRSICRARERVSQHGNAVKPFGDASGGRGRARSSEGEPGASEVKEQGRVVFFPFWLRSGPRRKIDLEGGRGRRSELKRPDRPDRPDRPEE